MSGGPALSFAETLVSSQADGAAAVLGTATSILPTAARFALAAGFFSQIGKMIRLKAGGRLSCTATPGTLTFNAMLGASGTIISFTSGAFTLGSVLKTNVTWTYEANMVCRSIGAGTSATMLGIGEFKCEAAGPGTASVASTIMLPLTSPIVQAAGFDSTVVNYVDLMVIWGTASVNTITCHQYSLESLN